MTMRFFQSLLAVLLVWPMQTFAQADPFGMFTGAATDGMGPQDWIQVHGPEEIFFFALNGIVTIVLAALIVYHPARRRARRSVSDLALPGLFFLYALIGMAAGFLVVQHGSIIGFVIFGIGSLLRFRSNLEDPVDTVEMILVTMLGLAVGLGLPVMAALVAVVAWVVIWFGGRSRGISVSLRGPDEAQSLSASETVEAMAANSGWRMVRKHHVPGKARVDLLFIAAGATPDTQIEGQIAQAVSDQVEVKLSL